MVNETEINICPNPKCHREIEEPILLNVLSATPAEQYNACPYCFIKLGENAENEEDTTQESGLSLHPSLEKVLDVISTQPQNEEEGEKEEKGEPPTSPSKEVEGSSGCPHHFGYLANRSKNAAIPPECLVCQKIVDCMLKLGTT